MTDCFSCKYFKQYQTLKYIKPGECGWYPQTTMPPWLENHMHNNDPYYGAKKSVNRAIGGTTGSIGYNEFCSAHEGITQEQFAKRHSDTWYEN